MKDIGCEWAIRRWHRSVWGREQHGIGVSPLSGKGINSSHSCIISDYSLPKRSCWNLLWGAERIQSERIAPKSRRDLWPVLRKHAGFLDSVLTSGERHCYRVITEYRDYFNYTRLTKELNRGFREELWLKSRGKQDYCVSSTEGFTS